MQTANGVIDVLCDDEGQAVEVACRYLAYFQGDLPTWSLRRTRRRCARWCPGTDAGSHDVHRAVELLADEDSALGAAAELRSRPGHRAGPVEGRAVGIVANNPLHQAGAIDGANADKAARFLQLCVRPSGFPWSRWSTLPVSWWGPRRRSRRSCAT